MITGFALGTLAVLLLAGLPIAFALGLAGLFVLYVLLGDGALIAVPQTMYESLDSFTLLSVPFFVLAADLLIAGGLTKRLVDAVETLLGHVRGGLAVVAVVACAFFAAISGSSAATAIAVGSVLVPEMVRRGYDARYASGLVAVAGSLGILIPPSIPMIVFGNVAEESVGKLFIAGIIPGLILTAVLIVMAVVLLGHGERRSQAASAQERRIAFRRAIGILVLPVIIAGTIYGGIATPTEAAGIAVVYSLIMALFVYRGFRARDLISVLADSAGSSAMILMIIGGATVFGYALTILQIPQAVTAAVLSTQMSALEFLIVVNLILLVLGMFLDIISILLLTSPIFIPIMRSLGIDPIHFAVIFVMNMELALITPPLGVHLFILSGLTRLPIAAVLRGAIPFALALAGVLVLVMLVPQLSLVLVR
jgi:C4-dicarboxylate transporter DctM subunit